MSFIIGSYDSRDPYGIGAAQNWSKMTHMVAPTITDPGLQHKHLLGTDTGVAGSVLI